MRKIYFIACYIVLIFAACKKEEDAVKWDTGILAPLVKSSMSINNLVADSLLKTNSDNSLSIVYQTSLYDASIDSLFKIPDTSATSNAKLETLALPDNSFTYDVTLGSIIKSLPGGTFFYPDQSKRSIAAQSGLTIPSIPLNAGQYFETMTLKSGFLDISITNGFPVDLKNISFNVQNVASGNIILSGNFPIVATGTTQTQSFPLDGKTVEKDLLINITNMDVAASSGPVLINYADKLSTAISMHDLKPSSATAIWPAQNLIDADKPIDLNIKDVQLTKVDLRKGDVLMDAYSTLQDTVYLTYKLPSATLNGTEFSQELVLPPAPPGGVSKLTLKFDFNGYNLDLTGINHNSFNSLYSHIQARIKYTGQIKTLSLTDSLYFYVGFKNLLPNYAEGYLGQQSISSKGNVPFELFKKIADGTITLDDINCNLTLQNGVGIDAGLVVNSLTAKNNRNGNTASLTGTFLGNEQTVNKAVKTGNPASPVTPTVKTIVLDKTNKSLIEILPDQFTYDLNVKINGDQAGKSDFVYYGSGLKASFDMEVPLNFLASKLLLRDTSDFKMPTSTIDKVKQGKLVLVTDNGFPLSADIQLYLLDAGNNKTDSLVKVGTVAAADLNSADKVVTKKRSRLEIPIGEAMLQKLKSTPKIMVQAEFSSTGTKNLKIYNDYTIDFKLVGEFDYSIK